MSDRDTVQYFDLENQMMEGATTLIIGKRASGKSCLLFDIMSHIHEQFSYGLALTPTQASRQKFAQCMPQSFIDRQSVTRLEEFVKKVNTLYDRDTALGKPTRNTYLVCDDTAFDNKFMRSKTLGEVFLNGRNFGMTCILVLQYLMKVGPDLRANADFVFVFWDNNTKNQEKIHEFWFNMIPKATFKEVFSTCTMGYSCLVMDVRKSATSRDWHDCVFWYRAKTPDQIKPFTMCDRDFFKLDQFCQVEDVDERNAKTSDAERIWRLGPDGQVFDVPSCMAVRTSVVQQDEEDVDDAYY